MSAEGEAEPQRTVYGDGITFVQWSLLWLLGGVAAIVGEAGGGGVAAGDDAAANNSVAHSEAVRIERFIALNPCQVCLTQR